MTKKISYKKSGVDINKANKFISKIKPLINTTKRDGWLSNIGAFAGFFAPRLSGYKKPVIVASTDGVGTKLLISKWARVYDTVGIDLVAMCVNDLVTCGAEPLFFLDYYATGKLVAEVSYKTLKGIVRGCRQANCALIGGETAELPGMYRPGDYDLAGFSIGMVDKEKIIDGSGIKNGDLLLGLASNGIHSNGYSFVRKVFSKKELSSGRFSKEVLKPTKIYVRPVLDTIRKFGVNGIAHITGGGFYDNISRLLPVKVDAVIYKGTWPVLPIFEEIRKRSNAKDEELFKVFNMGIGMVLVLPRKNTLNVKRHLSVKHGIRSWVIGEVIKGKGKVNVV